MNIESNNKPTMVIMFFGLIFLIGGTLSIFLLPNNEENKIDSISKYFNVSEEDIILVPQESSNVFEVTIKSREHYLVEFDSNKIKKIAPFSEK